MEATGESVRRLTDFGYDPSWSPDGKEIVVATEGVRYAGSRLGVSQLWVVSTSDGSQAAPADQGGRGQSGLVPGGFPDRVLGRRSERGSPAAVRTIPAAGSRGSEASSR